MCYGCQQEGHKKKECPTKKGNIKTPKNVTIG